MSDSDPTKLGLPDGYRAVPLNPRGGLGLSVSVLVAEQSNEGESPLIVLRALADALVCLGALTDQSGRSQGFIEIWFQRIDEMDRVSPVVQPGLNNHTLDERWRRQCDTMRQAQPAAVYWTGHEHEPAPPIVLDLEEYEVVELSCNAKGLKLCTDDQALTSAGLPAYTTSLHRYLWEGPSEEGNPVFYPVSDNAPENEYCNPAPLSNSDRYLDLNRSAGRIAVREFLAVDLLEYIAVLNGKSWRGVIDGRTTLTIPQTVGAPLHADVMELDGDSGFGRMFLGRHGRRGRIIETFHLKLRALSDMVASVHSYTKSVQTPHLGLSDASFRVRLADRGAGLPFLWGNRIELADPAEVVRLDIGDPGTGLYQPLTNPGASIYRPAFAAESHNGQTLVRIRRAERLSAEEASSDGPAALRIEATVRLGEDLDLARRDLIWLRVRPDQRAIDLYGYAERDTALAPGELRFTSVPFEAERATVNALQQAEGVTLPDCAFKVLPAFSSPCDLYALGVVGVQTLLVNRNARLPATLDELLSLGRWTSRQETDDDLPARIARAFDEDPRWSDRLGPHRVMDNLESPDEGFDLIPRALWWQTLAMLLRMFPGGCHDSTCRDYSDAMPNLLHKVFEPTLGALRQLITQSRGLIVIDWHYNREVHELLRSLRSGDLSGV